VELERLSHSQKNGPASFHRFPLLVADSLLLSHGDLWTATGVFGAGKGFRGIRATAQFVLQSFSIRDPHEAIQEGLRVDMQSDRGVARDSRYRQMSA
jgi:hypothetical protein